MSVWLQREKEMLQKPVETVRNLHTLLIALSNMDGLMGGRVVGAGAVGGVRSSAGGRAGPANSSIGAFSSRNSRGCCSS
ncbi:hypothetical protein GOODEAATRI_023981, partial [Goodea atripinnis]